MRIESVWRRDWSEGTVLDSHVGKKIENCGDNDNDDTHHSPFRSFRRKPTNFVSWISMLKRLRDAVHPAWHLHVHLHAEVD